LASEHDAVTKTCSTCGTTLPLDDFPPRTKGSRDGRHGSCRPCLRARGARYRVKARADGRLRASQVRTRYGVEPERLAEMLTEQDGRCYLCRRPERRGRQLCLDHHHDTGRPRRLLCDDCNNAIARAHEDPELLRRMAAYVEADW
jgi:hypothetical protein